MEVIKNSFKKIRHDYIVWRYVDHGLLFGEAVSYVPHTGEYPHRLHRLFERYEARYVSLGYKAVDFDDWQKAGGYGAEYKHLLYITQ